MIHHKSTEVTNHLEKASGGRLFFPHPSLHTTTVIKQVKLKEGVFLHSPNETLTSDVSQKYKWTQKAIKTNWWKKGPKMTIWLHSRCNSWLKKFPKPKAASNCRIYRSITLLCSCTQFWLGVFFHVRDKVLLPWPDRAQLAGTAQSVCCAPALWSFYERLHKCSLLWLAQIYFFLLYFWEHSSFEKNTSCLVFLK